MPAIVNDDLTIIGIGSSAGGLEAIRDLVVTLPSTVNATYVVVQHMSPHHKSLMTELVARQTALEVAEIAEGTTLKANAIFITPPNSDVVFENGALRLKDPSPEPASPKPSVNRFFESIALSHGKNSLAIVLSGTGSDGAYGVQAIREAGGITIAQDVKTAKYDGMPQAAVRTGCVDLILSPAEIGTHLSKILERPSDLSAFQSGDNAHTPTTDLLQILLAKTRVDFRDYKKSTVNRRIERRMIALGIDRIEDYTDFCRENPEALTALFKDLLISVTRFFRDKEEFRKLGLVAPELFRKGGEDKVRVWIAGCATGEEAYSIAMLLSDCLGGVSLKSRVQILATDLDEDALHRAREGIYPHSALENIPPKFAQKYTVRHNDGIRVVDEIRRAVMFSTHNIIQDPPFQKIDLLCCRNLLIYFSSQLQKKVFSRFHYSLTENGLLFLGTAESVAGSEDFFTTEPGKYRLYRKRETNSSFRPRGLPGIAPERSQKSQKTGRTADQLFFDGLVASLGQNSVLVAEDFSIARVFGNISPYIEVTENSNLKMHLDLLKTPYRGEARSLAAVALKKGKRHSGIRHILSETAGEEIAIRLEAFPIIADEISERAVLIVFFDVSREKYQPSNTHDSSLGPTEGNHISILEDEIFSTREALQQTIEELETSNEELQSLNEEMQSTNEELQAANEELETSNEELQSTNEELITVNEELQVTASELSIRSGELSSVLESTPLPMLVVDRAFQVMQATKSAREIFALKNPISNPHVSQCALPDGFPILAPICSEAIQLGSNVVTTFMSESGSIRLICSPYFDQAGQISGVTLVLD